MIRYLIAFLLVVTGLFPVTIECPGASLLDETIEVVLRGLESKEKVTLELSIIDGRQDLWSSSALFVADGKGEIHLDRQAPLEGAYTGVDPMGLFWTLENQTSKRGTPALSLPSFDLKLTLFIKGDVAAQRWIRRVFQDSKCKREVLKGVPFDGILHTPDKVVDGAPLVITLSGSNGGHSEQRAALLASRGIPALSLAYFGTDKLPQKLSKIPLEYFASAIDWVKGQPSLPNTVALYGVSRGAELALLIGSVYPEKVGPIVAAHPSSVIHSALGDNMRPAWTLKGKKIIPSALLPLNLLVLRFTSLGKTPENPVAFTPFFLKALERRPKRGRIPIEKHSGGLLLIVGEDDQMWPARRYTKDLKSVYPKNKLTVATYKEAGHCSLLPNQPSSTVYYHSKIKRWCTTGGTKMGNHTLSTDGWRLTHEFLVHPTR